MKTETEYLDMVAIPIKHRKVPEFNFYKQGTNIYLGTLIWRATWRQLVWRNQPVGIDMSSNCLMEAFSKAITYLEKLRK